MKLYGIGRIHTWYQILYRPVWTKWFSVIVCICTGVLPAAAGEDDGGSVGGLMPAVRSSMQQKDAEAPFRAMKVWGDTSPASSLRQRPLRVGASWTFLVSTASAAAAGRCHQRTPRRASMPLRRVTRTTSRGLCSGRPRRPRTKRSSTSSPWLVPDTGPSYPLASCYSSSRKTDSLQLSSGPYKSKRINGTIF
jgi:hypothetical protein